MSLSEELEQFNRGFIEQVPEGVITEMVAATEMLQKSGLADRAVQAAERDSIRVVKQGDQIVVISPGLSNYSVDADQIDRIEIYTGAGGDVASVASTIEIPVLIDGGAGADRLTAGGGPAVLVGGDGDDRLIGGRKRDILIGGDGEDGLVGRGAEDILVNGSTPLDDESARLWEMLRFWNVRRSREERIYVISETFLNQDVTEYDDGVKDTIFADPDKDWVIDGDGDVLRD